MTSSIGIYIKFRKDLRKCWKVEILKWRKVEILKWRKIPITESKTVYLVEYKSRDMTVTISFFSRLTIVYSQH